MIWKRIITHDLREYFDSWSERIFSCRIQETILNPTISQGDCNFDSMTWLSECSYTQRSDDDLDWLQASSSGNIDVGPDQDNTLGSKGAFSFTFLWTNGVIAKDIMR